jgi:hypothetical protein
MVGGCGGVLVPRELRQMLESQGAIRVGSTRLVALSELRLSRRGGRYEVPRRSTCV